MKILEVTSLGYIDGGIETGIVLTKRISEEHGNIVKILASDLRQDLPHFNDYTYRRPSGFIGKFFYSFNPYSYLALKKILREFQPDVVHIHTVDHASASIFFALKDYPTILTVHGPEPFSKSLLLWCFAESNFIHGKREVNDLTTTGKLRYFYHRHIESVLYKIALRNVDKIITLSHYMHDLMEHDGLDYNPLQKDNIPHSVAYAGRLETYKGVDYLLRALPAVIDRFPDTKLQIAGDGGERSNLEALAKKLGLRQCVEFLGQLNRGQLEKLYQDASVVVMPSVYPEAFGKIGIEAMSVGRSVIATNVGGISDWLKDRENGFLVAPEDSQAIARSICALFSDPAMYLRMALSGRKTAEEFDLQNYVRKIEKKYLNAIENRI
jgi:glycosyltransferase involved in cell wall biosynthesis